MNFSDSTPIWLEGNILQRMSTAGYELTGRCDAPLQWEFIFDEEGVEPSVEQLQRHLGHGLFYTEFEVTRYDLDY